jgi:hypothetical protein
MTAILLLLTGILAQAAPDCPLADEVISYVDKVTVRQYECPDGDQYITITPFHRGTVLQVLEEITP